MSSATVTPSLVIFGEPHPLSSTALRPRGPSVLRTALASFVHSRRPTAAVLRRRTPFVLPQRNSSWIESVDIRPDFLND